MNDDDDVIIMFFWLCLTYIYLYRLNMECTSVRNCWIREIYQDRQRFGYFQTMFLKMKEKDPAQFFIHTRMNRNTYELLLSLMKDALTKKSIRTPIDFECRLAITLS